MGARGLRGACALSCVCNGGVKGVGKTGVVGLLRGTGTATSKPTHGKCIGIRADMDALPIQELDSDKNAEYKSKNAGYAVALSTCADCVTA